MTLIGPTTDQTVSNEGLEAYYDWAADNAEKSFYAFRQLANPKFKWNWFTRTVATELFKFYAEFSAGQRPILLLQTPPQHGKSMAVIDFAAWLAGHRPDTRIVYASFSDRLGIRANLRMQRIMARELYRRAFPATRLSDTHVVTIAERHLRNHEVLEFVDQDGMFRNTTVNGAVTGEGFDLQIVDDPVKGRAEVNSPTIRDKTWAWFSDDLLTRQSEQAALLFIGTRWHVDDPAGRLLECFGNRARVLRFPAIAEHDEQFRNKGGPLFPEIKSLSFLNERRQTLTEASWEALYQQSPYLVGGGTFPIERFQLVPNVDRSQIRKTVRYVDKAATEGGGAYTAMVLMHKLSDGRYAVSDVRHGQWSALDREQRLEQTARVDAVNFPRYEVVVEQEPGSGGKESAESTIRRLSGLKVTADKVTGDKETRAQPYAAQVQGGNVMLVTGSWTRDFLDEHESFPAGKRKDIVDAAAGAFAKLATPGYDTSMAWIDGKPLP